MALLVQKVEDDLKGKMEIPAGWMTIEELEKKEAREEKAELANFEASVSRYLPLATKRAERLIGQLDSQLEIKIPVSYLTIENSTTFHVVMLVSQENFLSPEMQKAKILVEQDNLKDDEFDMHYSFTVGTEYMLRSSLTPDSYKLRNVPDFDKNLQIELVYLQDNAKAG